MLIPSSIRACLQRCGTALFRSAACLRVEASQMSSDGRLRRGLVSGLLVVSMSFLAGAADAGVIHVRPGGNDAADGSSWAQAKGSLWSATNSAVSGDEVWVAEGTYPYTFAMIGPGVSVYGGFQGTETQRSQRDSAAHETILTSPYWTTVFFPNNGGATRRIDGVTIRDSVNAVYSDNAPSIVIANNKILNNRNPNGYGAGVTLFGGTALVENNQIDGNQGTRHGGGIEGYWCQATVRRNTITRNRCTIHGGGIGFWYRYIVLEDNVITDNVADGWMGGANLASGGAVRRNFIARNRATADGGIALADGAAIVEENTILQNISTGHGVGGLSLRNVDVTVARNTISGNTSPYVGGLRVVFGVARVFENRLTSNAGGWGGGGLLGDRCTIQATSNVIRDNVSNSDTGGAVTYSVNLTATGNEIRGNRGSVGGLRCSGGAAELRGNAIAGNYGSWIGGLLLADGSATVIDNQISENEGNTGGAVLSVVSGVFSRNLFRANHGWWIGGLECRWRTPDILANTIVENVSDNISGGLEVYRCNPTVANNLIARNRARAHAGVGVGLASPRLINNTIVANQGGAAMWLWESRPFLANNIIAFNQGGVGASYPDWPTLKNNWVHNTGWNYGGLPPGAGDRQADPCLVNVAAGDYTLRATSMAIDSGDSSLVDSAWTDHSGLPRVANAGVDAGAFEFQGPRDLSTPTTTAGITPEPNAGGWNNGPVTVTLSASTPHDEGVTSVHYRAVGAQTIAATSVAGDRAVFPITAEGVTTVYYYAVDHCGHVEPERSLVIRIDRTSPELLLGSDTTELWPPNGKMVPVTISGRLVDLAAGVDPNSVTYHVTDEYGEIDGDGALSLDPEGRFAFSVDLRARRDGADDKGRVYTITVTGRDAAGNVSSRAVVVIVPHDQRKEK